MALPPQGSLEGLRPPPWSFAPSWASLRGASPTIGTCLGEVQSPPLMTNIYAKFALKIFWRPAGADFVTFFRIFALLWENLAPPPEKGEGHSDTFFA